MSLKASSETCGKLEIKQSRYIFFNNVLTYMLINVDDNEQRYIGSLSSKQFKTHPKIGQNSVFIKCISQC